MQIKLACLLAVFSCLTSALLEEQLLAFTPGNGSIAIHNAVVIYAADDPVGVKIAADSLPEDLDEIVGSKHQSIGVQSSNGTGLVVNGTANTAIIVGTLDSALIQQVQKNAGLNISNIRGKWETFTTTVVRRPLPGVENALVIAGSDKRGTMFGIFTVSEQAGQSPLHWWADVPAKKHSAIYALAKTTTHGEPTIKYRGLFINDESPGLTGWWAKVNNAQQEVHLDSRFYRHVFDMMIRLKANYIWPAMWASYVPRPGRIFFTDDPINQQLADDYGIVVSTSHHEPMQRATNEWNTDVTGSWDWTVNKDNVTKFMDEGIKRAGQNESYFTLGMRGPADSPIQAADPIAVLKDVFATERDIIAKYYGNVSAVNQVWTIYKEVATYYAAGLSPPDDVTLMFTDDNWGNIMRLPTSNETQRAGGFGVYFHFEYVGTPKSYEWQNTNNLGKVYKEMYQALQRGADRIWIFNLGDIKPMEMPYNFVMDLAWNANKINFTTIPDWFNAFAAREFGPQFAQEIGSILLQHNHLMAARKYELVTTTTYSVLNYHENERVLAAWKSVADRVLAVEAKLDATLQSAFFHLVKYPVYSGYLYHSVILTQAQNQQHTLEHRNTANDLATKVLADFDADYDLLEHYDSIENGKWKGILSQPKFDPNVNPTWYTTTRDVVYGLGYVQKRQDFAYVLGSLGVYAEQSSSASAQGRFCESLWTSGPTSGTFAPALPIIDTYGPAYRTIEIFHRGNYKTSIPFNITSPASWMKIEPSSGTLSESAPSVLVQVSVPDWSLVPAKYSQTVTVRVEWNNSPYREDISVKVVNNAVPSGFHGFPETADIVSIEGPHFQRVSSGSLSFEKLPNLGSRSESGSIALRPYLEARESLTAAQAAYAEYDFYLFSASSGITATVYINSNFDTDPGLLMQFSLTLNGAAANFSRVLTSPSTPGDLPPTWSNTVADGVWVKTVSLGAVAAGAHTLRWQVNSPEVYLEKIVLSRGTTLKASYLGPPETMLL